MPADKGRPAPGFGTLPTEPAKPRRRRVPSNDLPAQRLGAILGKYRITEHLGSGGMGAVYRATHIEIGKAVAIKVLGEKLAVDQLARTRFLREAETASRLQHRHVVNVMDYGSEDGIPFIVMELLKGEDLAARLERFPHRLAVDSSVDIMLAVCAGVSAAHKAGVIHRDLKPRNIHLARTQLREIEPKVLDFGISKMPDLSGAVSLTETGDILGTTHYLSPEQVAGGRADERTDQYALGVVLYECVTGRVPHEGDSAFAVMRSIREGKFLPPSALQRGLPTGCEGAILRAMSRDPGHRFGSVHEFGRAILPFASRRKQQAWVDYYRGEACETAATADVAASHVDAIPDPQGSASPRPGLKQKEFSSLSSSADLRPARSRARVWALAAGVAVVAVAAGLLLLAPSRQPVIHPAGPSAGAPVAVDEMPAEARAPTQPAAVPVAASGTLSAIPAESVVISVSEAPPDLVAVVDGHAAEIPLRWPRDGRVRRVVFRAPGFEPRTMNLTAREDRTIVLGLRPTSVRDSLPSRSAPAETSEPAGSERKPVLTPQSPPPLMDL